MNLMSENSLLQEIEEDLQRQRFEALWKRFGSTIIGAAFLIVAVTAAVTGWRSYTHSHQEAASKDLYQIALKADDKPQDVIAPSLDFAKAHEGAVQGTLSTLNAANAALKSGDKKQALELYDQVAADKSAEPVYRGVANLLYALNQLDTAPAADLEARLVPLAVDGPWRFEAKELLGHLALRDRQLDKAKAIFVDLMSQKDIPPGVGRRVADMVQWLAGAAASHG